MKRPRDFPGSLPPGAKILTTRLPPLIVAPPLESGSLVISFSVIGRPVPWKVPTVTRKHGTFKDVKQARWQALIARTAHLAMGSRQPYGGPVRLRLTFQLADNRPTIPDLTNLIKAAEDPLQGVVLVNDRQVAVTQATRTIAPGNFCHVEVYAL